MPINNVHMWLSRLFAIIPGLAVLFNTLYSPPDINHLLAGSVVELVGWITIKTTNVNKLEISLWSRKRQLNTIKRLSLLASICLLLYLFLYWIYVEPNDVYKHEILLPIIKNEKLSNLISNEGGVKAVIDKYGSQELIDARDSSKWQIAITRLIFIIVYSAIFFFITRIFTLLDVIKKLQTQSE